MAEQYLSEDGCRGSRRGAVVQSAVDLELIVVPKYVPKQTRVLHLLDVPVTYLK